MFNLENLSMDYKGKCGNCHARLDENDKYCRYCGTKKGAGRFLPYDNSVYCVYGPPISALIECKKCGNKWIASTLGSVDDKFCPECGSESINMLEKRRSW